MRVPRQGGALRLQVNYFIRSEQGVSPGYAFVLQLQLTRVDLIGQHASSVRAKPVLPRASIMLPYVCRTPVNVRDWQRYVGKRFGVRVILRRHTPPLRKPFLFSQAQVRIIIMCWCALQYKITGFLNYLQTSNQHFLTANFLPCYREL